MIPALEAEAGDLCELEASLVYKSSSRTPRATERNPVLKNKGWRDTVAKATM